jgi:hypothetical protein
MKVPRMSDLIPKTDATENLRRHIWTQEVHSVLSQLSEFIVQCEAQTRKEQDEAAAH